MVTSKVKNKDTSTILSNKELVSRKVRKPAVKFLKPEDLPLLLHNNQGKLVAGIKLDAQEFANDELRLTGWSLGSPAIRLIRDGKEVDAKLLHIPRDDVLQRYSVTSYFNPGFEFVVKNPEQGTYGLRWELTAEGKKIPIDFQLTIQIPLNAGSVSKVIQAEGTNINSLVKMQSGLERGVRYYIDCAVSIKNGILLLGWLDDRLMAVPRIYVQTKQNLPKGFLLVDNQQGVQYIRTFRPDVSRAFNSHFNVGIAVWLPFEVTEGKEVIVSFDKELRSKQSVSLTALTGDTAALEKTLIFSSAALHDIARQQNVSELLTWLDDNEFRFFEKKIEKIAGIDLALIVFGKALLLWGWVAAENTEVSQLELVAGDIRIDIKERMVRVSRSDLFSIYPWLKKHALGFIVLIDETDFLNSSRVKLQIQVGIQRIKLPIEPEIADWSMFLDVMNSNPVLMEPITQLLLACPGIRALPRFDEQLSALLRTVFLAHHKVLPSFADNPEIIAVAIDHVFSLNEGGMLLFGWRHEPVVSPCSVTVHGPEGQYCDVTRNFFSLVRSDVSENLKERYPGITDMCGFVCHVPLFTKAGEQRMICFRFGERGNVWLKLQVKTEESDALQLIKNILGIIPAPDRIRGSLYELFDRTIGQSIELFSALHRKKIGDIFERQFGEPPASPAISIIIPLYGRYDFIRHQLAHFVDDPDFNCVDLIYVVDDPSILTPALDMAVAYHQLFCKPFRVIWYGQNLGFAGANNIGAKVARADTLLLLNSDILPKVNGWLSVLYKALYELPQAGAVGALLQFADNSIQHAGMCPKRDAFFPGFLLNVHPGKGMVWAKGDEPTQQSMLTGACMMLSKADYEAIGGFDEGYIIGDFEDSDLCLKLRKHGRTLWLIPAAKLWHLERQSQNLENIATYRQLLTLYNGWRYHKKILKGEIANPEESGI